MLVIDTNVLVRLLVSDDPAQTRRARSLIEKALADDEPVLISTLVVLETEWVLRSRYAFDRAGVHGLFRRMLQARELSFEDEEGIEEALFNWETSSCGLPTV
jgi:predicted nucleic-acid-binding protein